MPLTRLSLKLLSFNAKLFQKSRMWSFSVIIFKASGADSGTANEKKTAGRLGFNSDNTFLPFEKQHGGHFRNGVGFKRSAQCTAYKGRVLWCDLVGV